MENNKEKIAARQKAYYEKNKEKVLEMRKAYREKNKEKIAARNKAYREKNKEKIAAINKAYYENNKEAERDKAYREKNKEKIKQNSKAWREKNKEKIAALNKTYNENNKEKLRAYKKAYSEKNKEKIAEIKKAWYEKNKEKISAKRKAARDNNKQKTKKIKKEKEIEYIFSNEDIEKCANILRGNSIARSNCRHLSNGILEYFRTEKLPENKANTNSTANLPYSNVVVKSETSALIASIIPTEVFPNQEIFPGNQIYDPLPEGVELSNFCDITNPYMTRYSHDIKKLTDIIIQRGQIYNYGIIDFLGIQGNVGHQLNFYKRKDEVIFIDCQFKKGERLFNNIESKYDFDRTFSNKVAFTMFSF